MLAIADHELHGLARIVRHGKWMDLEVADAEHVVAVEPVDLRNAVEAVAHLEDGAEREPHRDVVLPRERGNPARVIVVLVGDEDRRQRLGRDAQAREARDGVAHSETAIDEDAGVSGFDEKAVAFAAAADGSEAHYFS